MEQPQQNSITAVFGRKGSGKSYRVEQLVKMEAAGVWVDVAGLMAHLSHEDGTLHQHLPGWTRMDSLRQVVEAIAGPQSRHGLVNWWNREVRNRIPAARFRILYVPPEGSDEETDLEVIFEALKSRYRYYWKEHQVKVRSTIVVDEVDALNHGINTPAKIVAEMVKRGRHFLLDQVYATRRPSESPRIITSQADHLFMFHLQEQSDIDYFRHFGVPKSAVDKIPSFKLGDYIHWDAAEGTAYEWRRKWGE